MGWEPHKIMDETYPGVQALTEDKNVSEQML